MVLSILLLLFIYYRSLRHPSSPEQGGVSHLSVLPQHVLPFAEEWAAFTKPGIETIFSILSDPQCWQLIILGDDVF
jgi:hypothetical protein